MRSLALMMMYGSNVFRVVRTVIDPSTTFSSQAIPNSFSARVMADQDSLKYFSRYLGNRQAKEDSSSNPVALYSGRKGSISQ